MDAAMSDTPRTDQKEIEVRRQRASVRAFHAWKLARALERELAAMKGERDSLRQRLEIDDIAPEIDGIHCRDVTIRLLEKDEERLRRVLEAIEYRADGSKFRMGEDIARLVRDALGPVEKATAASSGEPCTWPRCSCLPAERCELV